METEDRDSEEAEKPSITFDPSLPTSHAVSDDQALQFCPVSASHSYVI